MQAELEVAFIAGVVFALACASLFLLVVYALSKPRPRIKSEGVE